MLGKAAEGCFRRTENGGETNSTWPGSTLRVCGSPGAEGVQGNRWTEPVTFEESHLGVLLFETKAGFSLH
jgi:hypothetical protein